MVINFSRKDNSELGFHECFYAMVFSVLNTAQIQYDSKGVDLNKMISCDENEIFIFFFARKWGNFSWWCPELLWFGWRHVTD